MFVGEIGFSRREFLHDIKWWEVKSIIRGYHARHHAGWEQARLVAYNAHYCMGSKDPVPAVEKWITFPWERKTEDSGSNISQAEIDALREEMRRMNNQGGSGGGTGDNPELEG
jgi:hypothetical protein